MESAGKRRSMASSAQKSRNEKPLLFKSSPAPTNQAVLCFPCKKPVRLSPTISAKLSPAKTPTKSPTLAQFPSKSPAKLSAKTLSDDISTPEKVYDRPSSRSRNKRIAKSLKDVIAEAKKLQMSTEKTPKNSEGKVEELEAKTPKAADFNLPEKYALLAESFDAMEAAIRLLRLRKTISTFGNICPQVEAMTNRRFMHCHVAQMKYILPEALLLEKMMIHDEKTLCMKAELKIVLLHDALSNAKDGHGFASAFKANTSILRKTFHTRLVEFAKSHLEGIDVPLEDLPEPFNKKTLSTLVKTNNDIPTISSTPSGIHIHKDIDPPITISPLLPKSFQKSFSHLKATAHVAPNSSCIPEQEQNLNPPKVLEVRKPHGSGVGIPSSVSSHFPAGFKSRFASKFRPSEISRDSNGLKKSYEIDSSPVLKQPDATEDTVSDPLETLCKVTGAKHISNNASKENTLCKKEMAIENASSSLGKSCFSITTERVEPDSGILDTVPVVPIAHKTPVKSCIKSSASKKTVRFENVPDSPDAISSPQCPPSLASPNSSCVSQLSEGKSEASNVKRAIIFNKLDKNSGDYSVGKDSSICEKASLRPVTLKRKVAECNLNDNFTENLQSTKNSMHSALNYCADSVRFSPSRMVVKPKKNEKAMNNCACPLQSPTKALCLEKIQNEETPEKVFLKTPPIHCPKRPRQNVDDENVAPIKETKSCPAKIQSPKKSIIQPCKLNFDSESNSSKETEIGSISVQKSCYEGLENISESEREILKSLSPELVSKVREREKKNLEDCKMGLSVAKRRQQMIACLPKLFNMIRDIFRSCKRSVITQQELVHKIISNHCDVTDRSEVEEQLQLLQELVPDWISGRTATSGDYLYSIKNNVDLQSIQTKLVKAV